jgi:hypothetical protein
MTAPESRRVKVPPDRAGVAVRSNVNIQNCARSSATSDGITGSTINGNFSCTGNLNECVLIGTTVTGNVEIDNNTSGDVENNIIDGNLQCLGNTDGVSAEVPNTVGGKTEGQCAGF